MNKDYKDFISTSKDDAHNPTPELDSKILSKVREDLEQEKYLVFTKMVFIQAFVGTLTMLFCPQFEMSLTNNEELFHFFHRNFGHYGCMAACGALFLGSGSLVANFLLNPIELNLIRKNKFLAFTGVTALSLSVFFLLGAEIYLKATAFWVFGAIFSSIAITEIKFKLLKQINTLS